MQNHEDISDEDPDSVLGRVRDIRRKWAVQEDEALAYRLQDEEIAQHYNSNRTRNAIVREDAPRAREAQRQEDLDALEERLKHLSVLQKQADEDGRLAKMLASRGPDAAKVKKHSPSDGTVEKLSPQELLQQVTSEISFSGRKKAKSPLLGAAMPEEEPGPSRSCLKHSPDHEQVRPVPVDVLAEEDMRKTQEEKDAAVAKALQDELDRYEKDRQLALEAQDRELAKMIHEKEKARLRRAKEKARLKLEANATSDGGDASEVGDGDARACSRNSSSSDRSRSTDLLPPQLPEKLKSPSREQIGFRANPKPLPPNPSTPDVRSSSASPQTQTRLEYRLPAEPVPPYMPIHGYHRSSSKRNK